MKKNKLFLGTLFLVSMNSSATSLNGFDMEFYGFVKASVMYSESALSSYNNINLSAPTAALAQTRDQDKTSRLSFQTQQSRLGFNLNKDQINSKLEFDFIDFNKSSPTTQMVPRVRIASVTYKDGQNKLIIGQDWDLFSPTTTYTYDYVGLYFLAGNSGFQRQQIQYLYDSVNWELGGAIGMAGNNPGSADGNLEQGKSPSYALRMTRKITNGKSGISGIYSSLSYNLGNGSRHDAYGLNAFYEKSSEKFSLKSEIYLGQNLANLGSLTIGLGSESSDVQELGGTLTGQYSLNDRSNLFGGVGLAQILNRSESQPLAISATNTLGPNGITRNWLTRLGYEFKVTKDLSWMTELSRFQTVSKIADNTFEQVTAHTLESGIQLRF